MKIGGVTITSGVSSIDDRTNWTERQIRGSEKKAAFGSWFGVIFSAILFLIFYLTNHHSLFIDKNIPNPILCVIAFGTAISLIKATWETIRLRRFGDPVLELNTAPIPLGGVLEGRLQLATGTDHAPEFTTTLACIHRSGNGKNTTEKILWSGESKSTLLLGGILPISIAVPTDQPQTNGANPFDRILWRLTVRAPFRGQAFLEKYEVPIGHVP